MKKYLIVFLSASIITLMVFMFSGCANNSSNQEFISDIRYGIFDGQNESYCATFTYGIRENPYKADGISKNTVEFGILSIVFNKTLSDETIVNFSIKINDDTITGLLEKNPYSNEYMVDIGTICSDNANISIEISLSDQELTNKTLQLKNINSTWGINYLKALEIGNNEFKKLIDNYKKNNTSYEIFLKISTQQETNFGVYFWTFSIISELGEKHNIVFSVNNGEILVKN